jgi:hypothetical protein
MMSKQFCVSGAPGSRKRLVLNQDGDDVHLDVNFSASDSIELSGDVGCGLPAIEELRDYMMREHGVLTSY